MTNLVVGGGFDTDSGSLWYSTLFIIYDNAMTPIIMGIGGFIIAPKKRFICGLIQAILWGIFSISALIFSMTFIFIQGDSSISYSFCAKKA